MACSKTTYALDDVTAGTRVTIAAAGRDDLAVSGEVVMVNRGNPPGCAFIVVRVEIPTGVTT